MVAAMDAGNRPQSFGIYYGNDRETIEGEVRQKSTRCVWGGDVRMHLCVCMFAPVHHLACQAQNFTDTQRNSQSHVADILRRAMGTGRARTWTDPVIA